MRVQLVKPPAAAEVIASSAGPSPSPVQPGSPTGPTEQLHPKTPLVALTGPAAVISTCMLAVGLLTWSIVFRLPASRAPIPVNARAASESIPARISDDALETLRQSVRHSAPSLLRSHDELGPLLYSLETRAKELGWRANVEMKPAVPKPGGLTNLTLHPITITLEDEGEQPSPYARLLTWLRTVSTLPKRAEVTVLRLRAAGAGLAKVDVELRLFSLSPIEPVTPPIR